MLTAIVVGACIIAAVVAAFRVGIHAGRMVERSKRHACRECEKWEVVPDEIEAMIAG